MKRFVLLLLLIAAGCAPGPVPPTAAASSPHLGGTAPGGLGGAFQGAPSPLYATDYNGELYMPAGSGGSSYINSTFMSDTGASGIAIDPSTGNVAVATSGAITVSSSNFPPTSTIESGFILDPTAIAYDTNSNLYAVTPLLDFVSIFGAPTNGNQSPTATIGSNAFNATNPCLSGVAVDRSANVYVSVSSLGYGCSADAIYSFGAGMTGNVNPSTAITGSNTGLHGITDIAYGAEGIYVTNFSSNTVTIYPTTANGNVAPAATIGGSKTTINGPAAITVDVQGYIYVANYAQVPSPATSIAIFAPNATGNVAPLWTIQTGQNQSIAALAAYNSSLLPASKFRR